MNDLIAYKSLAYTHYLMGDIREINGKRLDV